MKESVSPDGLSRVQKRAAAILEESNQAEEAVLLFRAARDWTNLVRLVLTHAPSLLVQGRMQTLQEWLHGIPKEVAGDHPWLLYWSGVCGAPFDPAGSRALFERALRLFEAGGDEAGALLSWSAIVQTILFQFHDFRPLDPWVDWIDERIRQGAVFTSPAIEAGVTAGMTGILAWRSPDRPDRKEWLNKALSLPRDPGTADTRLRAYTNSALYHIWMGEFSQCRFLIREMRAMTQMHSPSPLRLILLKVTEAMLYNSQAGRHDEAARAVAEGLNLARETGMSLMSPSLLLHGAMSSLNAGDARTARGFLAAMERMVGEDRRINLSHYFFMAAWCELFSGSAARAVDSAQRSLHLIELAGAPTNETLIRLVLAHALYECGDLPGARSQLDKIRDLVSRTGSSFAYYLYQLTEAYCALDRGDRSFGLEALAAAMRTGRRNDFTTMLYFWRPSVLTGLCAEALDAGMEVPYALDLIAKLRLVPDERTRVSEAWPWPVRVITLGRFSLLKDGKPAGSGRKVQHKPLMLLKVLITFGGAEVPEEKITDLLWPDSDGDAAHSAFSTTLQRLRVLAGNDRALLLNGRRLTLDPRFCRVDAWAFEQLHERADALWRSVHGQRAGKGEAVAGDAYRHGEKALELYQGCFLPGESGEAWTAAYRERLRNRYLRLVLQQGLYLEESAQWRQAAEVFQRGLETDELAEEFYQHLMVCCRKLGQKAEAIRVYDTCRAVLSSALGIAPSQQTEALYASLMS
jgi:DNA-binding SARP family transcriptional activator